MENNGYIKLHRKLLDNIYCSKPNYVSLWVFLLLKANHKEATFLWNGEKKTLKAGQFITGRNILSKETGMKASTLEDILKTFESQQQIRQQKNNKFRIITIVNWERYQGSQQQTDIKTDNKATSNRQQGDTNKNDNNEKNEKNIKSGDKSPTPKENATEFFKEVELLKAGDKEKSQRLVKQIDALMEKYGVPYEPLFREIVKFANYWTELNSTGTKQRWQKQEVFEIGRRLTTWFGNIKQFQGQNNNNGPKLIKIK